MTPAQREYTIRDTSSLVFSILAAVVVVAFLVLIASDVAFLLLVLPFALLFLWAVWLVLFRPRLRYTSERVVVVNILRTHELPWARVRSVEQRLNIVFHLDDASRVVASGTSASRGPGVVVGGVTGQIEHRDEGFTRNESTLDAFRASAAPSDAQPAVRWNTVPLLIGAALLLACVVDLIVAAATAA